MASPSGYLGVFSVSDLTGDYESLGVLSVVALATALGAFSRKFPDTTYVRQTAPFSLFPTYSLTAKWLHFAA